MIGVGTCDKGLPAMTMALASFRDLAGAVVPGGVTLPPRHGEDAGAVQTLGARFAHGLVDAATRQPTSAAAPVPRPAAAASSSERRRRRRS